MIVKSLVIYVERDSGLNTHKAVHNKKSVKYLGNVMKYLE
jgi:hypothetical protein